MAPARIRIGRVLTLTVCLAAVAGLAAWISIPDSNAARGVSAPVASVAAETTGAPAPANPPPTLKISTKPDPRELRVMVPMRDGVKLHTEIFLPKEGRGPWPVVLIRGPYPSYVTTFTIISLRERGYAMVMQECRGTGKSEGTAPVLFRDDGWAGLNDGHEALRWIAKQPWSNGRVGTFGFSALGVPNNMMAPDAPEPLRFQYTMFCFSDMYSQCCYQGGVFREDVNTDWLQKNSLAKNLERLLLQPRYGPDWDDVNTEPRMDRVGVPTAYIAGWYDMFLQGSLNSFELLQRRGRNPGREISRLIIGPWGHAPIHGLDYPGSDMYHDHPKAGDPWRLYDHFLRGEELGVQTDKRVHYYVMGDPLAADAPGCFWRAVDAWPPSSTPTSFHFHADGMLRRESVPKTAGERAWKYDPANPVPTLGGLNFRIKSGPMDQRELETRPDVLLFTSPPLAEPLELTGRIRATVWLTSDRPDTDVTVKLTDVYPDGASRLVADGIIRARYHKAKNFEREDFLSPGEPVELSVDLWSTSLIVAPGHRLRVAISSSNSPRFQPNPNTGKPRGEAPPVIASNVIHLSPDRPSRIILPVRPFDVEEHRREKAKPKPVKQVTAPSIGLCGRDDQ
jgi:hypothetical protein